MSGGSLGIRSGSYGSSLDKLGNVSSSSNSGEGGALLPVQSGRKGLKMNKEKERLYHSMWKFEGRRKVGMLLVCVISAAVCGWILYVGKGEGPQEGISRQNISLNSSVIIRNPGSLAQTERQSYNGSLALPPPPAFFLGYALPPGHPCNTFTLPPPPADKKRTGPTNTIDVLEALAHMAPRIPVVALPPPLPPSLPSPAVSNEPPVKPVETEPVRPARKIQPGHRRDRRSGSKQHIKANPVNTD